jgi:Xaa-Pro aminopeptidase
MLYAAGLFVAGPFIYFRFDSKCHVVVNDLQMVRARRKAPECRVISYNQCVEKLRREVKRPGLAAVISLLFRERRLRKVFVPANFPHGLARELRNYKIKVRIKKDGLFPQREFKSADELKKINGALIMAEVGLAEGIQALKTSKIGRDGKLLYHGVHLTSEKLRAVIDTAVLQAGGLPAHTMVAGGAQACDPHEPGHGPLRAHEPIILNVFPRSQKTGYFGDLTRTVVRGRASDAVRRLYETVTRALDVAFAKLSPQNRAIDVHATMQKYFNAQGYKTCKKNRRMHGFFHGAGHGLGLDLREAPRLGPRSRDLLAIGQVVTLEPGLYYPGIGGVRLEDVATLTPQGARNLTKFEKTLEI